MQKAKTNMKLGFTTLLGLACLSGLAQSAPAQDLTPGYYIVVAAYLTGQESYARTYSDKINQGGRHAKFGFDASRKFYYVYLDFYTDFNQSIQQMLSARKDGFDKAWVRIMKGQIAT